MSFFCLPAEETVGWGLSRMPVTSKKLLVLDIAALGWDLWQSRPAGAGPVFQPLETVFPAVTCAAQATFRTGRAPAGHGVAGNGFYDRRLARVWFWEQSAGLVAGPRLWEPFRARGGTVGLWFWQQSLGEACDGWLSPRPIHKHHGGMIMDCASHPDELYARLQAELGRPFPLHRYWGPLAGRGSTAWIADAVCAALAWPDTPDVLLAYLPNLDYDLQRHGPGSPQARAELRFTLDLVARLTAAAEAAGRDWVVFGDYAIAPVTRPPCHPNRALRAAGLLKTRSVRGMAYPDLFSSEAFAVADHELAFVHAATPEAAARARSTLERAPGVGEILDPAAQAAAGLGRAADLVVLAEPGSWCAYPWWENPREAPDYATHVDIHNKPGYDPCELFFGFPPPNVSRDAGRIRGAHGRAGADRRVAYAASFALAPAPRTLADLAQAVFQGLETPGGRS